MQAYLAFTTKSFIRHMAYRTEVWMKLFGNLVLIVIQISIWKSLIGNGLVNGITLEEMITYSVITTANMNMLMLSAYRLLDEKLKNGSISVDLQKPISYPLQLFSDQLGLILFQLCFNVVPLLILSFFIFRILPPNPTYLVAYIISIFIAIIISFLLAFLVALISFWVLTTFALSWTLNAFITVFSGSFVPLWFFTPFWLNVANALPFKFLGFIPTSIYLGQINDVYMELAKGVCWIIILLLVNFILWKSAIKNLVIQGG